MVKAGENLDISVNTSSVGGGDIEYGVVTPIQISITKMEHAGNNCVQVEDIDKWVASLERILEDVPLYMCSQGHPGRISRIPQNLREVDVKGYEPYFMSLGPYHHGKPRLHEMELRKRFALKCVLRYKPFLTLKDLLKEMLIIEPTARSFYSDIEMDSESFLRMLLIDSVYIVTTFCGLEKAHEMMTEMNMTTKTRGDSEEVFMGKEKVIEGEDDMVIVRVDEPNDGRCNGENWHWIMFAHDLFLIENQLPFFLLERIHNLVYGGYGTRLVDTMKYEIANMLTDYTRQDLETISLRAEEVHHLLHLCHMFFRPSIRQDSTSLNFTETSQMFRLGSASQLYEAGVHFESRSASAGYSLLDISFDTSGYIAIPCLYVDDNTESLLRNLIALEQMKYPCMGLDISAYIVLLLHLVTTPKDVELLRRKGIIRHHLASDKEMMYLVNRLSTGLAFDYVEDIYSLKHVFHELKLYSARRVPRWKAWLKHRHFSNPWTAVSLLVASLFLLMTVLQTYYTVFSYYYPHFNGHS